MTFGTDLVKDFNQALEYGTKIRIKYYTTSISGTDYDDNATLTASGSDIWTSGLICPIDAKQGSYDALLMEQGKIQINDRKIYVPANTDFSSGIVLKLGVGSPVIREYALTEGGVIMWETKDSVQVYKKVYVKQLPTGSLIGEG
jgi:hypothetical protein